MKVDLRAEEKKGSLGTTESDYYMRNRNHRDLKDLLIILALKQTGKCLAEPLTP